MKQLFLLVLLFAALKASGQIDPTDKVFYGLLHAHSMVCDGSGAPEEAYAMAKMNGLNFFALTPHNHANAEDGAKERADGVLIATTPELYNGAGNITVTKKWKEKGQSKSEKVSVKPVMKAAQDATTSSFLGLYGQEYSTISKGNHVNVLGVKELLTDNNGDFKALVRTLDHAQKTIGVPICIQLNHPNVHEDLFYHGNSSSVKNKMFNDYGIDRGDLGPHFRDMAQALSPYVHLIEVLSGPAMAEERKATFKYRANDDDYYFYLKQGLHISPSAGQDNHYKTWGNVTDARMGIVCKNLAEADVYGAFKLNRTFVTEDKNLKTILYINSKIMGSSIKAKDESELNFDIALEDADEPESEYEIFVYSGEIMPELSTAATEWKAEDGLVETFTAKGNGIFTISGIFAKKSPSFYYVKVVQNDNDRAWTAPIWVNESEPTIVNGGVAKYYWTSSNSSKVYHIAGCSSVDRIKPENLMRGDIPPDGRTKHNCKVVDVEGH